MDLLFPVFVAVEVYKYLDWLSVAVVCRVTATVRRAYQPPALDFVKKLVRQSTDEATSIAEEGRV